MNGTGRAGVSSTNAPLTKVAWIRGNDGWNRKYRVHPLGATHPSLYRFYRALRPSARGPSPAVVLFNRIRLSIRGGTRLQPRRVSRRA
jgi:hypothetical protein